MYRNRFFADGNSSSSEESSDDEQQTHISTVRPEDFLRSDVIISNNDNENIKHIVQSEKDKRYAEIEEIIKKIKQAINIRDISEVYECFGNLIHTYDKARRVIEKEGSTSISRNYIKILTELDHFVNQCWNDENWRNTLNKTNSSNLSSLRQKLRRYLKEQSFTEEKSDDESIDKQIDTSSEDEDISKKLTDIIAMRGKRGTNYQEQLDCLTTLRQNINEENIEIEIKILVTQIAISFDYLQQGKLEIWSCTLDRIEELLTLLSNNINLLNEFCDDLMTIILQMNEEFIRILENTDHHTQDYINRLKDESRIYSILDQVKLHFELINHENLSTIYLCIIEYIYYKYDKTSIELIDRLCKYIYTNSTLDRERVRSSLFHIYHLALHDYYHEARELMLMSHIQDTIHSSDISTQILFNRTMVQLGLCAFRFGAIHEAHQALVDIQSSYRLKELLGQDLHSKHLPFHMHINLQLIECIYLISAMLIETSSIGKRLISRHFYNVMKQEIYGPPESIREHIIAACHAMKTGDSNACVKFLINDKMNVQVWNLIPQASEVCKMLINKIKEESLRMYLLTNATVFSTISISTLADKFEVSIKQVYGIICKMITNKELMGSIEASNQVVIMDGTHSSKTQALSVELMDKLSFLHEQNEKINRFYVKSNS